MTIIDRRWKNEKISSKRVRIQEKTIEIIGKYRGNGHFRIKTRKELARTHRASLSCQTDQKTIQIRVRFFSIRATNLFKRCVSTKLIIVIWNTVRQESKPDYIMLFLRFTFFSYSTALLTVFLRFFFHNISRWFVSGDVTKHNFYMII